MKLDLVKCVTVAMIVAFMLLCVLLAGCGPLNPNAVHNTIPAVGNNVNQAESHVKSADGLVARARPESNKTGQSLLDATREELAGAVSALEAAQKDLFTVQQERDSLKKSADQYQVKADKLEHSWGYRVQVWVTRAFWLLMVLLGVHYIGGLVALFVPGPIGATLSVVSAVVNPAAWFQTIRDNIYFRRFAK
jgi:hypothetical protein